MGPGVAAGSLIAPLDVPQLGFVASILQIGHATMLHNPDSHGVILSTSTFHPHH
jgi:hypothetical protein